MLFNTLVSPPSQGFSSRSTFYIPAPQGGTRVQINCPKRCLSCAAQPQTRPVFATFNTASQAPCKHSRGTSFWPEPHLLAQQERSQLQLAVTPGNQGRGVHAGPPASI